jgi:hypothetical protein
MFPNMARMLSMFVPAILLAVVAVAADKEQPELKIDPKLAPLARFEGEWTVDGKWSGGTDLHARAVYEWGLAGKILRARTYVTEGDKEYQRYEATMAWHPGRKCLYEISFTFDGTITEHRLESKDATTVLVDFSPLDPEHPGKTRQTLTFIDNDHHSWKVELQGDSGWLTLIDATWVRKK